MLRGNLLTDPDPRTHTGESIVTLTGSAHVRIERIISHGHVSLPDFFYDQTENEYVVVIQGQAELEIEGVGRVRLGAGDWLDIPAHLRHRVAWTDPDVDTIWLAVFY